MIANQPDLTHKKYPGKKNQTNKQSHDYNILKFFLAPLGCDGIS